MSGRSVSSYHQHVSVYVLSVSLSYQMSRHWYTIGAVGAQKVPEIELPIVLPIVLHIVIL